MCRRHLMVVSPRVFPLCEKLGLWNNFIPRFSSDIGLASPLQNRRGREMCTSSRRYPTLQAVNRISWNKFRRIEAYARGSQSSANSSHRNPPILPSQSPPRAAWMSKARCSRMSWRYSFPDGRSKKRGKPEAWERRLLSTAFYNTPLQIRTNPVR